MLLLGSLAYLLASIVFYAVTTQKTPSDIACVKTLLPSCKSSLELYYGSDGLSLLGADLSEAMAEEAIEYELRNFHDEFSSKSIYRGPPTVERESKWDSLAPCKSEHFVSHFGRLLKNYSVVGLLPLTGQHITASSRSVAGAEKRMTAGDNEDVALVVPGFIMSMDCLVGCCLFNTRNPLPLTKSVQENTSTVHIPRFKPDNLYTTNKTTSG